MTRVLKRHEFLTLLSKCTNKQRRDKLIDIASAEEIKSVAECILNVVNGNVKVPQSTLNKLKRKKGALRKLIAKRTSTKQRKLLLHQTGGFLSAILPIALSTLVGVLPQLLSK